MYWGTFDVKEVNNQEFKKQLSLYILENERSGQYDDAIEVLNKNFLIDESEMWTYFV